MLKIGWNLISQDLISQETSGNWFLIGFIYLVIIYLEIFCSTFEENGPARGFSHRFSRKKVRSFFSSDWKARVGEVN